MCLGEGTMIVYGKNASLEVLKKGSIKNIYLSKNFDDSKLLSLVDKSKVKYLSDGELGKYGKNHQGIVIEMEDYEFYDIDEIYNDKSSSFIVVLDHLEDPHNFGAIIRTCECAGVDYIIIPNKRSVSVNETVMKTSSGALMNVRIAEVANLRNTLERLKKCGYWVIGLEADGEDYRSIDYSGKTVLVVGSEGNGLKHIVRESCDIIASLPMKGEITSLNASVAAGIMIYEVNRGK